MTVMTDQEMVAKAKELLRKANDLFEAVGDLVGNASEEQSTKLPWFDEEKLSETSLYLNDIICNLDPDFCEKVEEGKADIYDPS
jgi:hypothetical protein